jgi:2-polyprenyl-3-methyl-5-hydroxy-6-metoxy-1,4-benzoquinol methylase
MAADPEPRSITMSTSAVRAPFDEAKSEAFSERFHETMAEESAQTVVAALHEHILPLAAGLEKRLESGVDVLDVGCGSGRAACALAKAYPASRFTGYDLSEEAIAAANALARDEGLTNASFAVRDITALEEPGSYDLVTAFDIVHDQKKPATVLANIHSMLRSDGTSSCRTSPGRATSRRTWTTRSAPSVTRSRPCTA